jgi:hypothetical protein
LGGIFGSSVISVQACREAPFYAQQKNRFLHIADKHVNVKSGAGGRGIEVELWHLARFPVGGAFVPAFVVGMYAPSQNGRIHRDKRRRDLCATRRHVWSISSTGVCIVR